MLANRRWHAAGPVSVDRALSFLPGRSRQTLGYNLPPMMWTAWVRPTLLAILLLLAASACGASGRLLEQAGLSRSILTPSSTDRLDLSYTLARAARVSLSLALPDGRSVDLLADEPRPAAGTYVHALDGTVPVPDHPGERRVLPDGTYRLSLQARDAAGRSESAAFEMQVQGADTS